MEFRKAGRVLACMAALSAPWTMAAGKCERLVATGSPDAPPYSWQDPKDPRHLIGANVDLDVEIRLARFIAENDDLEELLAQAAEKSTREKIAQLERFAALSMQMAEKLKQSLP